MALPHFRNSVPSVKKWEPVYPALFELTLIPPFQADTALLLEHVVSVGGLDGLNPSVQVAEQKFKQATRSYATFADKTTLDLSVTFSMNINDANENYIYTTLRKWCNLTWNPLTGTMGLKVDYCGSGTLVQYNRDGSIYRKITLEQCFPINQLQVGGDFGYDKTTEVSQAQITFRTDVWDEQLVGL